MQKKEKNKRPQPTEKRKTWPRNQKQSKNKICQKVQEEVETAKTQGDNAKTTPKKKRGETQKKEENQKQTKKLVIETGKNRKDQINDNWMHVRIDSLNHVTTRRNGQQSVEFGIMISLTRKDYQNMRSGKIFVAEATFCCKFCTKFKEIQKRISKKKKKRKTMNEWLFFIKLPKFRK